MSQLLNLARWLQKIAEGGAKEPASVTIADRAPAGAQAARPAGISDHYVCCTSALTSCLSEAKHRSIYWHSKLSTSSVFTVKTYTSFQVNFQFSVSRLFKLLIGISILV